MGFDELIRKKVGGSLSNLPPLRRLEMLRRNALLLSGQPWRPPVDEGTLIRKMVGWPSAHPRSLPSQPAVIR